MNYFRFTDKRIQCKQKEGFKMEVPKYLILDRMLKTEARISQGNTLRLCLKEMYSLSG